MKNHPKNNRPPPPIGLGQGLTFPKLPSEQKQALEGHMAIQSLVSQFEDLVEREKERDEKILELWSALFILEGKVEMMELGASGFGSILGETTESDTDSSVMSSSSPRDNGGSGKVQGNTGADVVGHGKSGRAEHSGRKGEHEGSDDGGYYGGGEELKLGMGNKKKGKKGGEGKGKKSGKRGSSPVGGSAKGKGSKQTSEQKGLDMNKVCGGRVEKKAPKKKGGK